jgi:uncharacterized membrane protein
LFGIAWFGFLLGFAREEEFDISALCAGPNYCLELMSAYAITVVVGIVGLTMLLVAGYQHHEETVKQYTPYPPAFSAAVLLLMGVGFVLGVFWARFHASPVDCPSQGSWPRRWHGVWSRGGRHTPVVRAPRPETV